MYSGKYWCFSGGGSSSQVCDRMFHSERKPLHSPAVSKLELPSSHAEGTLSTPAQNSLFPPHREQTEKLTLQPVSAVYELGQPLIFKTAAGMLMCCWLLCGSASVKKKKKKNLTRSRLMSVNSMHDTHICQSGWYFYTEGRQRERMSKHLFIKLLITYHICKKGHIYSVFIVGNKTFAAAVFASCDIWRGFPFW